MRVPLGAVGGSTNALFRTGVFVCLQHAGFDDTSDQGVRDWLFEWELQVTFRPRVSFNVSHEIIVASDRRI